MALALMSASASGVGGGRNHLRRKALQRLVGEAEHSLAEFLADDRRDTEPVEERREVLLL